MTRWIEKVSFNDHHFYGGIKMSDLPSLKDEYRAHALEVLNAGTADHVAYCHIQYDEEGNATAADFYSGIEMDDKTFYERTSTIPGTDYIGAVHRHGKGDTK
jgi:hypothetical protein